MEQNAPACPINRDQEIKPNSGAKMPFIPVATDLASALAAINAMRNALLQLAGMMSVRSGGQQSDRNNKDNSGNERPDPNRPPRWIEVSRKTQKVRVKNKEDPEQYVDVERINRLVMRDTVTGDYWVWNHNGSKR